MKNMKNMKTYRIIAKRLVNCFSLFALLFLLLLSGCVKKTIYNTDHPAQGKLTLTTDWTNRSANVPIPDSYTAEVGVEGSLITDKTILSGTTAEYPNLLDPEAYTLNLYNTVDKITLSGTTATADYTADTPLGWFFSGTTTKIIEKDTEHSATVVMYQQLRELTLIIAPTGGVSNSIIGITASLSGVAETLDITNNTHGTPTNIPLIFSKITSGSDAGKWSTTVRLLGVIGTEQKLTGTITFTDGEPSDMPLTSDLSDRLKEFNTDKKVPLTIGGTVVETPTATGTTATITGWTVTNHGDIVMEQVYSVGDYYPDPNVTLTDNGDVISGLPPIGVVFWLDNPIDGKSAHGKIVSMDESEYLRWSDEGHTTNAYSEVNGEENTYYISVFIAKSNAPKPNFQAYQWCVDKGARWYLPAKNELKALYAGMSGLRLITSGMAGNGEITDWGDSAYMPDHDNKTYLSARNNFNKILTNAKGTAIDLSLEDSWYWSSTDEGGNSVYYCLLSTGFTEINTKSLTMYARAVSAF